ncbi:hypothetical protein HSTV2_9 [Halorubrum sodomense tailed virus 2]|uniref:Uncharacterized protein n=1 Tax=Halorubrum sodomense tailed virus 2 TaxID=1262527 RepID=L7TIR2_9CAUD|nr:hypothetical protein HSTV2_9 [Halorubrum sodomense tailed virus 2]AGC34278.1 hypothetical protein HSTV2_9 [Halorubrum sodomense tailed virus 2]
MNPDEKDKLDLIHEDINETRKEVHEALTRVEVVDERTERIDAKTEKVDQRVFGPGGLESQVHRNRAEISRLQSVGVIVVSAASAMVAKILDILP